MFAKDNLHFERTRSNTPRYLRSQELRRFKHASGNRMENCRRGTLTQFHERVAVGRTRIFKDKQYMQRIKDFKHDAQLDQKHHYIAEEFIRKINKKQVRIYKSYREETISRWLIFEKLIWLKSILQNWNGSLQRHHRKSEDHEGLSLKDACLGKPRSLHAQRLMKSQLMEQVPARKIRDRHGMMGQDVSIAWPETSSIPRERDKPWPGTDAVLATSSSGIPAVVAARSTTNSTCTASARLIFLHSELSCRTLAPTDEEDWMHDEEEFGAGDAADGVVDGTAYMRVEDVSEDIAEWVHA